MQEQHAPESLNPEQDAAVNAEEAVLAVIAGPGTGKTRTLIARIVHLIRECGVKPSEITAVTFTNQAAAELRERLEAALGGKKTVKGVTVGTFHAVCLRILQDGKLLLGENERREIVKRVLKTSGSRLSLEQFISRVSAVKNGMHAGESEEDRQLYVAYQEILDSLHARVLDDLLLDALELNPEKLRMFHYLLVDEFQDINPAQLALVTHWGRRYLFVIGDPDQSIYGFRGANAACFEVLREQFPELRTIRLRENYRGVPSVLNTALTVISHNPGGQRELSCNSKGDIPVRLVTAASPFAEAVWITKEIERMTGGLDMLDAQSHAGERQNVRAFSDIAVLCRTRRQMELLENCPAARQFSLCDFRT